MRICLEIGCGLVKTVPIFDNGLSLFHDALYDDMELLDKYVKTKYMKNANDFMLFAETIIDNRVKKKIKKLINFKFKNIQVTISVLKD